MAARTRSLCSTFTRSASQLSRQAWKPFPQLCLATPHHVICRGYSTDKKKVAVPKEAMQFLESIKEQMKPQEDKITMEQAVVNMGNWVDDANTLFQEGKLEKAIKFFNKVIDMELPEGYARTVDMRKHTATAYIGRAQVYSEQEKSNEAMLDYKHLLENFDDDIEIVANVYLDRASLYFQQSDLIRALEDVNKILEGKLRKTEFVQELLPVAYKLRAHIHADLNSYTECIADATFLISKNKSIENYMFRGNLFLEFGKSEEAKQDIDTADEMGADDYEFWLSKALIYIQLPGGEEQATKSLKKAIRRNPQLEKEMDDFPTLNKIFEEIQKSKLNAIKHN